MDIRISFIIPVYNRPQEIRELLKSLCEQVAKVFEVVIVEDGSTISSETVVNAFHDALPISYYTKSNSGPGASRNFGMSRAKGDFFIILDSDCVLPKQYLKEVNAYLSNHQVDFFGGPDAADASFSNLQKAINFTMTSFLTTGGVRGSKKALQKFEPRSFNMGISKTAFEKSGGFGRIHPGEDPDLTIRLWDLGFKSAFVEQAFVFHKRRISWPLFFKQVHALGRVRPILMKCYPAYAKPTYWLPLLFVFSLIAALVLAFIGVLFPLQLILLYFILVFGSALVLVRRFSVALMVMPAFLIQMFGYAWGFLKTKIVLMSSKGSIEEKFPNLYFKQGHEQA